MFTGLIEQTGELVSAEQRGNGSHFRIRHRPWKDDPLLDGESIAVQGVCLTVTHCAANDEFECDILAETLATTNMGRLRPGDAVNLERATRQSDRLGGHILSGHIDGVGRLTNVFLHQADHVLRMECGPDILSGIVARGSIAVDGVSLTVTKLERQWFETHIIPHTWNHTSLRDRIRGDTVNLETDILGKYVARYLSQSTQQQGLTLDDLARAGFA